MDAVHIVSIPVVSAPMSRPANPPPPRSTYRHGDLRRTLLDAGIALARAGGPDAVVLREATRQAGVAPNAAYRHFASRQDLLDAVRAAAVAAVAQAMEQEIAQLPSHGSAADRARAAVRAVGTGYLRFAREETGLFRTAFGGAFRLGALEGVDAADHNPFRHLSTALDQLVAAGALPPARRPHAEFLAWSTVHGMALLAIDGPLRDLPAPLLEPLGQRLLDMVERGL